MKKLFALLILTFLPLFGAAAQSIDVRLETRGSFVAMPDDSGFQGDYFNVRINGTINDNFSYSFHHRLNKPLVDSRFFNATDWAYIKFDNGKWGVQAGKMQLEYGSFEFDAPPIDMYFSSEYYDHFNGAFTFGLNLIRHFKVGTLVAQVAQSAFSESVLGGLRSYSLCYKGSYGCYDWIHSVNSFDIPDGSALANIVLGNRFTFGPARLEFDFIHRSNFKTFRAFDDITVITNASVSATKWMDVVAKFTYDCNGGQDDPLVAAGQKFFYYGGGLEFFPMKDSRDIRIHCIYYDFRTPTFLAGVTWKIHILTR